MGMNVGGTGRVPVYNGTAAAMAALAGMIQGDLFYTTDTKLLYTYDGAAWNNVLAGISQQVVYLTTATQAADAATLTTAAITTTGYRALMVFIQNVYCAANGKDFNFNINGDTAANYNYSACANGTQVTADGAAFVKMGTLSSTAASVLNAVVYVHNLRTNPTQINFNAGQNTWNDIGTAQWKSNANITTLGIKVTSGENIMAGAKIVVYGVV